MQPDRPSDLLCPDVVVGDAGVGARASGGWWVLVGAGWGGVVGFLACMPTTVHVAS
jgi:hypothetical protein